MGIRNRLYDLGLKPSVKFEIPVIGVGNLTVGGTGKTPMIEHLIRILEKDYRVATLSRGYGRKTKGLRIATSDDDAYTLGDEPFQFYTKFGKQIKVAVGEDRAYAIPFILDENPATQIILLDDAFQHRRVKPSVNILLTDYNRLFFNDFLLPAGRLRESRNGASRADAIVVTKCPAEISDDETMAIEKSIRKYADRPVFFTKIHYGSPQPFKNTHKTVGEDVILISGIANHKPLVAYVSNNFKLVKHIAFRDHHFYSTKDLKAVLELVESTPNGCVITTEKDMVKIDTDQFSSITSKIPFFYLPMEVEFIKNGRDFDALIQTTLEGAPK